MKYEKPVFQDLGEVLSVANGTCSTGSSANDYEGILGVCASGSMNGAAECSGGSNVFKAQPSYACAPGSMNSWIICGVGGTANH